MSKKSDFRAYVFYSSVWNHALHPKLFHHPRNMPCCLHIPPRLQNLSFLIYEKGWPDRAHKDLSIVLFLSSCSKLLVKHSAFIADERNFQGLFADKCGVRLFAIFADAHNRNPLLEKQLVSIRKFFRLKRTSRRIVLGIEIEEGFFVLRKELSKADFRSFLVGFDQKVVHDERRKKIKKLIYDCKHKSCHLGALPILSAL